MSSKLAAEALQLAVKPLEKLVLFAISDQAQADSAGSGVLLDVPRIAWMTCIPEETVLRTFADLKCRGVLREQADGGFIIRLGKLPHLRRFAAERKARA